MFGRFSRPFFPLILLLAISAVGCGDDPAQPAGDPPALPPLASMQADVSLFDQAPSATASPAAIGLHFLTAAVAVTVARTATVVIMAIPVATFAAAASATPVFEDGAFHWRYSAQEGAQTFQADLSGRGQGTESIWEMRISTTATTPVLDDFLWYTGRAALSGESGEWHVFDAQQPTANREVLSIDWTHPSEDRWTLVFTNVNSGDVNVGDQLTYAVDGSLRTVRHVDPSEGEEIEIQWSAATGAGYLEAPGYNEGARSCWDEAFDNIVCPSGVPGTLP